MKRIFTNEDKKYMVSNYLNKPYKEIAEYLGFSERQVRGWLNNNGYVKNRKINDHYFDEIDSPIKAYLLGYIFADGWVCCNFKTMNYEFGMELQSRDKYILDKINQELGGLNKILHKNETDKIICGNSCHSGESDVLRVYSKNLVLGLIKNGVETNKTLKDTYPKISDDLFFDWLRGYIDGDGCFWKYRNNYYMHITCASKIVLEYVQQRLQSFNIETKLYKENDKKYRLMCVNIKEMKKLVAHLYYEDGLFCLKRKYDRVKYYLGLAA